MKKAETYKIGDPFITHPAAANFIADHLTNGKDRELVYHRAAGRIRAARKKGILSRSGPMKAIDFFSWAVQEKDWAWLANISGLPFSVQVNLEAGLQASAGVGRDVASVDIKTSKKALQDQVAALAFDLQQTKRRLEECIQERDALMKKEQGRSETAVKNGRLGGRKKAL